MRVRTRLAEGTAIYHMLRNIGSSVHISLSTVLVVYMTQASHSELSPHISRFNEALSLPWVRGSYDLADPRSLAALEAEIARQASMLGHLDSFWAFTATALVVLPLMAASIVTMQRFKLQETHGRWLKGLSGTVMLVLAMLLLLRPAWLHT